MSHEPRATAVARPLALVVTGGRQEAVSLEETLRRYFAAGLARLVEDGTDDPRAALEALEDCARVAFARYNRRNDRAPDRAPRTDDEV